MSLVAREPSGAIESPNDAATVSETGCKLAAATAGAKALGVPGDAELQAAGVAEAPDEQEPRGKAERTLWIMLVVNLALTVAQLACGVIGNSLSLLGDGALMAMDGISYAISLYVERRKERVTAAERLRADRIGSGISVALLAATTFWLLFDVIDRLLAEADTSVPQEEVSAGLMIGFTVINLLGDAGVVLATWGCGVGSSELLGDDGAEENMNLAGALAHLAADVVRGVAVLVCGVIAAAGLVDPALADAYCSLFVCLFVISAAATMMRMLLRKANPVAYAAFDDEPPVEGDALAAAAALPNGTCRAADRSPVSLPAREGPQSALGSGAVELPPAAMIGSSRV